jgi:protoporphyrinogen oxidase
MPRAIVRKCLAGAKTALSGNGRRNKEVDNLESWFISKFGNGIARYFLIPYNSKFWMVPLRSLTYEWAQQIVPVPTFDEIVSGATRKSAKKWGDNAIFWYPRKGGIHQLPLAMASELKNISTNCAVRRIDCEKRILETERGQKEKFDYLIMTIPLPELRGLLKNVPRKIERYFLMLRWNSIFNINLGIEGKAGWFCHWTYFPEKKISFFRSILPHRFSPSVVPRGRSSLSLEIAYKPGQPLDNNTLMKRAIKDAKKVGLLSGDQRISLAGCHDIAYGYPIHDHNYARARHEILRFLRKHHIICAGRYGGWRYMSMEDVILEGKAIAEL